MTDSILTGVGEPAGAGVEPAAFHIVSVGWPASLIEGILDRVQRRTAIRCSHVVLTPRDREEAVERRGPEGVHCLREDVGAPVPAADPALLASLEAPGVPTINNMILGDRVVGRLDYAEAAGYATLLARRLDDTFQRLRPSLVLGGFDGLHGGVALAVARRLGVPWVTMNFTTVPRGLSGFCAGMTPDLGLPFPPPPTEALRALAERTLADFEQKAVTVPLYESANSVRLILRRLPVHLQKFAEVGRDILTRRYDRYRAPGLWTLCRQYVRKRVQLLRLPHHWMRTDPPVGPFVFFGLHMQPEAAIDVWAPFHADQFAVIEAIARAVPPTHDVVVKLHRSDADNYSRRQLNRLRRLPRVVLASPFAQSREFIERAALVFGIQGTIGMEAALLGRPVLMFGESPLVVMPSVARVQGITDLPALVREKLGEAPPGRDAIVAGLMRYLSRFQPGCYNDWEQRPSEEEIDNLARQFDALRHYLAAPRAAAP